MDGLEALDSPKLQELLDFLARNGATIGRLAAGVARDLPAAVDEGVESLAAASAGDAADQLSGLVDDLRWVSAELHPLLEMIVAELPTFD